EFREGFEAVDKIDRPAVTIFGSARVLEDDPAYVNARKVAARFAEAGWAVVTGGGPGVMEAANRGAQEAGGLSVGFNIELPHEQRGNRYVDLSMTFRHFYARKTMFVKAAAGFRGAEMLRRDDGHEIAFVTITRFESYDAVRAFAGESYEDAVIEPEARALLSRHDERSEHFEVAIGS